MKRTRIEGEEAEKRNLDDFPFTPQVTFEDVRQRHQKWIDERDWAQFHSPRNVLLALIGEVGEVSELFQWRGDAQCQVGLPTFSTEEKERVAEELADVQLNLIRLASVCHVDLVAAMEKKVEKNTKKYPADVVKGSSKKYTEY
eukprot:PhF_6_TR14339/c0_g1_i1/m.22986/K16904/DCTPP1; dCTP diphosphatase